MLAHSSAKPQQPRSSHAASQSASRFGCRILCSLWQGKNSREKISNAHNAQKIAEENRKFEKLKGKKNGEWNKMLAYTHHITHRHKHLQPLHTVYYVHRFTCIKWKMSESRICIWNGMHAVACEWKLFIITYCIYTSLPMLASSLSHTPTIPTSCSAPFLHITTSDSDSRCEWNLWLFMGWN